MQILLNYGWIKKRKSREIKTNTGRQEMYINEAYNVLNNEYIGIEQQGKRNRTAKRRSKKLEQI